MDKPIITPHAAKNFINQVRQGINHALPQTDPVLIMAHGGVHRAICCLLGIQNHPWIIDRKTVYDKIIHCAFEKLGMVCAVTMQRRRSSHFENLTCTLQPNPLR